MKTLVILIVCLAEIFIVGKYWFSILETRFEKKMAAAVYIVLSLLNAGTYFVAEDNALICAVSTLALHMLLLFAIFEDGILKKIAVYVTYLLSVCAAEAVSLGFVMFIYESSAADVVRSNQWSCMWQMAALIFMFIFSTAGFILLKKRYSNSDGIAIQYIYLYISIQALILAMFYMLIYKHGIVSFVMLAVSAFVIVVSLMIGALIYKTVQSAAYSRAEAEFIKREDIIKDKHISEMEGQHDRYMELCQYFYDHVKKIEQLGDSGKAKEYVRDIRTRMDSMEQVSFCNNLALDALLHIKSVEAHKLGIKTVYEICDCEYTGISDFDMCTVVSNLLDNGIEAASRTDDKYIRFKINKKINKLVISMINSSPRPDPQLKTTKSDSENHGLGLKSIEAAATANGGSCTFKYENNEFVSVVTMDCKI